jgi:hypothetical protein
MRKNRHHVLGVGSAERVVAEQRVDTLKLGTELVESGKRIPSITEFLLTDYFYSLFSGGM